MRTYRVFNHIDRIDVEWTLLGQRWRLPSRGALIAAGAVGAGLANISHPWTGVAVWLAASVAIIYANMHINRMDREGLLREVTQAKLLIQTMRTPVITNAGRLIADPNPIITNARKRI